MILCSLGPMAEMRRNNEVRKLVVVRWSSLERVRWCAYKIKNTAQARSLPVKHRRYSNVREIK